MSASKPVLSHPSALHLIARAELVSVPLDPFDVAPPDLYRDQRARGR